MWGSRRGRAGGAVLAALLAVLSPVPAGASTLELFGFGGRSPGLVGNGVATTDDFASVYINPAGLAQVARTRLAFGALYGDFHLEMDDRQVEVDPALGTVFGAAARLHLGGPLRDRLSLGFAAFVPTEAIARADWPITGEPVFAVLGARSQVVALQLGLGGQITERLRAGVAVLVSAGLGGSIFVSSDAAGRFTSRSEQTLIARAAPIVGVQYRIPEAAVDLGLVFRAESDDPFDVKVENDLINELPLTIPTLNIGGVAQFDPLTVAIEGAWRPVAPVQVSAQLAYYRWSEFEPPTVNPVGGMPPPANPDFSDTVVPRLSGEWRVLEGDAVVDARGGYAFVMSPAPEADGQQSLLDNHRHVASLGVGLAWPGQLPLRFDVWVQGHLLMARSHEKDPGKFPSDAELPFTTLDTGGRIVVGGLTMGVEL